MIDYGAQEACEFKKVITPKKISTIQQNEIPEIVEIFANVEFSDGDLDVEMEIEAPVRATRSQSRNKETSMPPSDPQPKRNKVKRVIKTKTVEKSNVKQRRRRIIEEEESDAKTDDGE